MKGYILFIFICINLISCSGNKNKQTAEEVITKASEKLNSWETARYTATTINKKTKHTTVYNLKKVAYEAHLNMFFTKEIDQKTTIYYKLASLSVIEDKKKKITTFDYGNDRSIPKYLNLYMGDKDALLFTKNLLNNHEDDIVYDEQLEFNNTPAYVYTFKNYKLWIDADKAIPLKLEINGTQSIIYKDITFNEKMDDTTFSFEKKEGYISTVAGIKKEPLLNTKAPNWKLLDLDGKEVTLNSLKGSPIFLEAWISTCSHCMESLPKVKQIQKEFGDKIKVVTVNLDYDIDLSKETVKNKGINYLVLQGNASFEVDYDIQSYPSYYIIDREGTIIFSKHGTIKDKKEKALIDALKTVK